MYDKKISHRIGGVLKLQGRGLYLYRCFKYSFDLFKVRDIDRLKDRVTTVFYDYIYIGVRKILLIAIRINFSFKVIADQNPSLFCESKRYRSAHSTGGTSDKYDLPS